MPPSLLKAALLFPLRCQLAINSCFSSLEYPFFKIVASFCSIANIFYIFNWQRKVMSNRKTICGSPDAYDATIGCTCLITGSEEIRNHEFNISITPNPSTGFYKIFYLLPQNKPGNLKVYDVNRKLVLSLELPTWSTSQTFDISSLHSGIYIAVINANGEKSSHKVVLLDQ